MPRLWPVIVIVALFVAGGAFPLRAAESKLAISAMCERVAEEASRQTGVPVSVLKAISLTETGRKLEGSFKPWPWTVNMEGAGHWFDTLDEARAYVFQEFKRGARSFDVGCFQINYKWHNQAFSSIDEMFDPLHNALYAAKFLGELYGETGSWEKAAGAYHSRTKEFADRYAARFTDLRQRFAQEDGKPLSAFAPSVSAMTTVPGQMPYGDVPEIPDIVLAMNGPDKAPAPPRVNSYPLLKRSGGAAPPLGSAPGASLFATALQRSEVN